MPAIIIGDESSGRRADTDIYPYVTHTQVPFTYTVWRRSTTLRNNRLHYVHAR